MLQPQFAVCFPEMARAGLRLCVGLLLNAGIVLRFDTRTSAGLANTSTFRKVFAIEDPGGGVITRDTALADACKAMRRSMVSTLRSYLSVGMPRIKDHTPAFRTMSEAPCDSYPRIRI
ncbi:hypothetical protein [Pararhodobacter sp.]|uniref:hypothetical protein n=1 Tax=Pararhodobacter sp. TaxID=2127056 RepID=UPI002AFFC4D4|nr:hypothetical protein [Pararhodobacter sp.]